jgi:hypothetical protein
MFVSCGILRKDFSDFLLPARDIGEGMDRTCGRCDQVKDISEFAWRRKGRSQYDNYCRPCRAAYGREHYEKHRARYIAQAGRRNAMQGARRFEYLVGYLGDHPCVDCGESDPVVLEFDHLGDKSFTIGKQFRYMNWEKVLDEMAKCDVVCANCHRRRTAERGGWGRLVALRDSERPAMDETDQSSSR